LVGFIPDTGLGRYMEKKPEIPAAMLKDAKTTAEGDYDYGLSRYQAIY